MNVSILEDISPEQLNVLVSYLTTDTSEKLVDDFAAANLRNSASLQAARNQVQELIPHQNSQSNSASPPPDVEEDALMAAIDGQKQKPSFTRLTPPPLPAFLEELRLAIPSPNQSFSSSTESMRDNVGPLKIIDPLLIGNMTVELLKLRRDNQKLRQTVQMQNKTIDGMKLINLNIEMHASRFQFEATQNLEELVRMQTSQTSPIMK